MIQSVFSCECDKCQSQHWLAANSALSARQALGRLGWLCMTYISLCPDCRDDPHYDDVKAAYDKGAALQVVIDRQLNDVAE